MMKQPTRCLITGCEGFIGSHLADFLLAKGIQVFGTVYAETGNLEHLEGKIVTRHVDLQDPDMVAAAVAESRPDIVFHLAAQSFVTVSWQDPEQTLRTNVLGSFHLLDTIKRQGLDPIIEIVSTSAVYGPCTATDMPLAESREFRPTSMYAVSKVAEDMLGYFYGKVFGLRVIRIRPFNMTGPRKTDDAVSDFTKGIVEVEKGRRKVLEVGNLECVRDFIDGRDAVRGLWTLAEHGRIGETYNLCSGKGRSLKSVLDLALGLAGHDVAWTVSPEKMRVWDDPIYVGDNSKLLKLGWGPVFSFEQTLQDSLDFWRRKL